MRTIWVGHSPDPDDAYMFYALTHGKVGIPGVRVGHLLEEIESLNRRALAAELDVTAISAATYPEVAGHYVIMDSGASMGKGYGPILVTRFPVGDLKGKTIAVPGIRTTAYLLLRLFLQGEFQVKEVPFDKISDAVLDGKVDAGLLIHEGQITYQQMGLHRVMDMGELWLQETGLPLPLGINVIRRDLGPRLGREISDALRRSIAYAREHTDEAVCYALRYGRGIDSETCKKFVLMYVNEYTETLGEEGREAIRLLFKRAVMAGLIPCEPPLDIV